MPVCMELLAMNPRDISALIVTAGLFTGAGFICKSEHDRDKHDYEYSGIEVKYDKTIAKTENRSLAVMNMLGMMVMKGRYSREKAEHYAENHYEELTRTKAVDAAVNKGVDAFKLRWPDFDLSDTKIFIQKYPISHNTAKSDKYPLGIVVAHGVSYPDRKKIYVTVMPMELGGLGSTSSLVVHEYAHMVKYRENNGDSDYEHSDKEFWKLADSKVH